MIRTSQFRALPKMVTIRAHGLPQDRQMNEAKTSSNTSSKEYEVHWGSLHYTADAQAFPAQTVQGSRGTALDVRSRPCSLEFQNTARGGAPFVRDSIRWRVAVNFTGCPGQRGCTGCRSRAALPSQLGVSLSGGGDDAGQGINEMPLGANASLIGVT